MGNPTTASGVTDQSFPSAVHSVFAGPTAAWPLRPQGKNECSFSAMAHALNIQAGQTLYDPLVFRRAVGPFFQAALGGTLPPLKAWQLRRLGYGSHYGSLAHTDAEFVWRELIDLRVPVIVDIYSAAQWGRRRVYGQHAVVLVGYSDTYHDAAGVERSEYYLIDSEWPRFGRCDAADNVVDRDGDGVAEDYPGNRTVSRAEFLRITTTRTYTPIFPDPLAHARWYQHRFSTPLPRWYGRVLDGSRDIVRAVKS